MTSNDDSQYDPCEVYYQMFTNIQDKSSKQTKHVFLSPCELRNSLITLAQRHNSPHKIFDSTNSNPDFLATIPRKALALLLKIATKIADEESSVKDIGFVPHKRGTSVRFHRSLDKSHKSPTGRFLGEACRKMRTTSGISNDDFVYSLVLSALGCHNPSPPRILPFVEPIITEFLDKNVYHSKTTLHNRLHLMATEGISAALVYLFDSFKYNGIVLPGDTIAVLSPIQNSYLELADLSNYDLNQICIQCDPKDNWDIPPDEIDKLSDSNIRAFLLMNPGNPTSLAIPPPTIRRMAATIRQTNPDLIIIEDNSYSPLSTNFNCFFNVLPRNTISLYSFSNYFGTTGWQLALIAMHNSNLIDMQIIKDAPDDVHSRYYMISTKPQHLKFLDRVSADSRQIMGTYDAGLSGPQQILMGLFAAYDLSHSKSGYKVVVKEMLEDRMNDLLLPLSIRAEEITGLETNYYAIIDIAKAADNIMGGTDFSKYIQQACDPIDFCNKLAKNYGVIVFPTVAFAGSYWGIRVSLACLPDNAYEHIGNAIRDLIDHYYEDYKRWENTQRRIAQGLGKRR